MQRTALKVDRCLSSSMRAISMLSTCTNTPACTSKVTAPEQVSSNIILLYRCKVKEARIHRSSFPSRELYFLTGPDQGEKCTVRSQVARLYGKMPAVSCTLIKYVSTLLLKMLKELPPFAMQRIITSISSTASQVQHTRCNHLVFNMANLVMWYGNVRHVSEFNLECKNS